MMTALSGSWQQALADELSKPYMEELFAFIAQRQAAGKTIYPEPENWFAAFEATPLQAVKVVILGQDPYHGPGQAHGLSFSVQPGERIPPSLRNIYKELNSDLAIETPAHGCLLDWAREGVLLLNATLTVEEKSPGAHQGQGWERFTDSVITLLSERREHLVFMLWGSYAQSKAGLIDDGRHLVLKAVHPSPLSAHRGFLGCRHFSRANDYLVANGCEPVEWRITQASGQLSLL